MTAGFRTLDNRYGRVAQRNAALKERLDARSLNQYPLLRQAANIVGVDTDDRFEQIALAVTDNLRRYYRSFDVALQIAASKQADEIISGGITIDQLLANQTNSREISLYVKLVLCLVMAGILVSCAPTSTGASEAGRQGSIVTVEVPNTATPAKQIKTPEPKPTKVKVLPTSTVTPETVMADGTEVNKTYQDQVNAVRLRMTELGLFLAPPAKEGVSDVVSASVDVAHKQIVFKVNALGGSAELPEGSFIIAPLNKDAKTLTVDDIRYITATTGWMDITNGLTDQIKRPTGQLKVDFKNGEATLFSTDKEGKTKVWGTASDKTGNEWVPSGEWQIEGKVFDLASKSWISVSSQVTSEPTAVEPQATQAASATPVPTVEKATSTPKLEPTKAATVPPTPVKPTSTPEPSPTKIQATPTKESTPTPAPTATEISDDHETITSPEKIYSSFKELESDAETIFDNYGLIFKVSDKWGNFGPKPFFKPKGEEGEKAVENFAKVLEQDSRGKNLPVVDSVTGKMKWLKLAPNATKEVLLLSEAKSLPNLPIEGKTFKYLFYSGTTGDQTQSNMAYIYKEKDVVNGELTKIYIVVNNPGRSPIRDRQANGWFGVDSINGDLASILANDKLFKDMVEAVYGNSIGPLAGNEFLDFRLPEFRNLLKVYHIKSPDGKITQFATMFD